LVVLGLVRVTAADSNFTDANWSSMGGFPGANGDVTAAVVDGGQSLHKRMNSTSARLEHAGAPLC